MVILHSDRLIIREVTVADADLIVDFIVRNLSFLEEWVPKMDDSYCTIESQVTRIKNRKENSIKFHLFHKQHPKSIIGDIGISNIVKGAFQSCHLGYSMLETETNKGYMTEAIQKVLEFLFEEIKLHRIEANVMPNNDPSKRVLKKLGFINEGLSRKYLKINGQWEDHERFVIWNEEV